MALALARHNIKVNAIGPGSIMTDVLQAVAADKAAMDRSVTAGPSDSLPACATPLFLSAASLLLVDAW